MRIKSIATPATIEVVRDTFDLADELRELKDLLDEGLLTQDEFDAKKRQLLGV